MRHKLGSSICNTLKRLQMKNTYDTIKINNPIKQNKDRNRNFTEEEKKNTYNS